MTEPVAYLNKYLDKSTNITRYKPENQRLLSSDPLYTADQLHPRVKMTKKQLNAFTKWNKRNKLLSPIELIWNVMGANEYPNEFGLELQEVSRDDKYLLSLANIWSEFDADNPEETIEIVPNMKWFVRSKERDNDGDYAFLTGIVNTNDWIYSKQHDDVIGIYPFETKEQAELWTNPLTEAVLLPVGDE